ncbi:hypothetical protein BASA81_007284 [Batrachochytrium salamandrivorans]|nr:hypothetical protein BASA81_007284 [Batrachochytrium salamandrivorans]
MGIIDLFQRSATAEPQCPGLVLFTHEVAQSVELGATAGLGLGIALGLVDLAVKKRSPLVKTLELCELGVSLGCVVGMLLLAKTAHEETALELQTRAAKVDVKRKSDSYFVAGGLVGSLLCAYVLPERWMRMSWTDRLTRGFCLGGALGALPLTLKVIEKFVKDKLPSQ